MTTRRVTPMVRGTVTFRDGRGSFTAVVPARYWKSHVMRAAPYNADWFGCKWSKSPSAWHDCEALRMLRLQGMSESC